MDTTQRAHKISAALRDIAGRRSPNLFIHLRDDADGFIRKNIGELWRLTDGGRIVHLGSGGCGDAYCYEEDTDRVLKFEGLSPPQHNLHVKRFRAQGGPLARWLPIIHEAGELRSPTGLRVAYSVMERFRAVWFKSQSFRDAVRAVIDAGGAAGAAAAYVQHRPWLDHLGEVLRLDVSPVGPDAVPAWVDDMVAGIGALVTAGVNCDFHIGNAGVRRSTGRFVWFD